MKCIFFSLEVTKVKCQVCWSTYGFANTSNAVFRAWRSNLDRKFFFKAKLVASESQILSATAQIVHIIISGSPGIPYYPNHVINYVMKASAAPTFWYAEPRDNDSWFPSSSSRLGLNWSDYQKVLSCQGCLILPVLSVCCSTASFCKCSKKTFL